MNLIECKLNYAIVPLKKEGKKVAIRSNGIDLEKEYGQKMVIIAVIQPSN